MKNLDQNTWKEKLKASENALILDVRTPKEWSEGIIPGAEKLDIMDTDAFLETLKGMDKSKEYFVYCRSGNRSGQACQVMDQLGFEVAYNLEGGILEWSGKTVSE